MFPLLPDADKLFPSYRQLDFTAVSAETLYLGGLFHGNAASCPPPLKHGVASCSPAVESNRKQWEFQRNRVKNVAPRPSAGSSLPPARSSLPHKATGGGVISGASISC